MNRCQFFTFHLEMHNSSNSLSFKKCSSTNRHLKCLINVNQFCWCNTLNRNNFSVWALEIITLIFSISKEIIDEQSQQILGSLNPNRWTSIKWMKNDFVTQNRNFIQFLDAAERGVFSNRKNSRGSSCLLLAPVSKWSTEAIGMKIKWKYMSMLYMDE